MLIKFRPFSFPNWLIMAFILILPFLYIPLTVDSQFLPKQVFIFLISALAFLYWVITSYREKKTSGFDF